MPNGQILIIPSLPPSEIRKIGTGDRAPRDWAPRDRERDRDRARRGVSDIFSVKMTAQCRRRHRRSKIGVFKFVPRKGVVPGKNIDEEEAITTAAPSDVVVVVAAPAEGIKTAVSRSRCCCQDNNRTSRGAFVIWIRVFRAVCGLACTRQG